MAETIEKKKHFLARKDEFRLADWLRSKKDLDQLTLDEAAALASKELGINVGRINLRIIAVDLGIKANFKRAAISGRASPDEGVKARIARLEHLVASLYAKLGEAMPNA